MLVCICIFCHKVHNKELRLTNIYESLLSGSSVSILSYSSVSLSDELHTLIYDELDTGNIYFLSRSYDDLIVDIFVILA